MSDGRISPKKAAEASSKFYEETTGTYPRMSLEEVELKENYWYVTLGIDKGAFYTDKDYKVFKVNAKTGVVESMTIKK